MIFDWFKKPAYSNVVKFPDPTPYVEPPKKEQEYYSIGVTSENRITFKTGISTLTMNEEGIRNLIEQLEVFADQLPKEETDEQS
jgi:hypothetical protein